MTVSKDNQRYQITLTPEEKQQLKALCQVTKERPSTFVRRLIATEKRLYDSGFLPSYNSKIEK
jgi:predicted DNA-binding protein